MIRKYRKRKAVRKFVTFRDDLAIYEICCTCASYNAAKYDFKNFKCTLRDYQNIYCSNCGRKFIGPKIVYKSKMSIIDIYNGTTLDTVLNSLEVK